MVAILQAAEGLWFLRLRVATVILLHGVGHEPNVLFQAVRVTRLADQASAMAVRGQSESGPPGHV